MLLLRGRFKIGDVFVDSPFSAIDQTVVGDIISLKLLGSNRESMSKVADILRPHFLQWIKPKNARIDIHKTGLRDGMAKSVSQQPLKGPLEHMKITTAAFNAMLAEDQKKFVIRNITQILVSRLETTSQLEAMNRINATDPSRFRHLMQPEPFEQFLTSLGGKPNKWKFGIGQNGSNTEFNYKLTIQFASRNKDDGWVSSPGDVLLNYLKAVSEMCFGFNHRAFLLPPPESGIGIEEIDIKNDSPSSHILELYVYSADHIVGKDLLRRFNIDIRSSFPYLGRPPKQSRLSGQHAKLYISIMEKSNIWAFVREAIPGGKKPVIMLEGSLPLEDDNRIKAEILDRARSLGKAVPVEAFDIGWAEVANKEKNLRVSSKCILSAHEITHETMKMLLSVLMCPSPVASHPATSSMRPLKIDHSSKVSEKLLVEGIRRGMGLSKRTAFTEILGITDDIFETVPPHNVLESAQGISNQKSIAVIILTSTFLHKGQMCKSPATKVHVADHKGRIRLHSSLENVEILIAFTQMISRLLPSWLRKAMDIAVDVKSATFLLRDRRKAKLPITEYLRPTPVHPEPQINQKSESSSALFPDTEKE